MTPILYYYLVKHWEAMDKWLFDHFEFGLVELGQLAEKFLIEVTQ